MQIDTNNSISITEINQDFSRVTQIVDKNGAAVIMKNDTPRYVIMEYSQFQDIEYADDATVMEIGKAIIERHIEAFKELAK
ncbi:MAG: type II toxin-antitoxin system Phd/YefM family antitoxin [Oscillospiraceae bacterium]|nr:type II toxin-antitoxin system Phd/YefM family antitoxin [Oscillospiraceae bacterium]